MFEKEIPSYLTDQILQGVKRDVAIERTALAAEEQANLSAELLKHAESAEQRSREAEAVADKALKAAAKANDIAVVSIIISSLLAVVGIIIAISIGVSNK